MNWEDVAWKFTEKKGERKGSEVDVRELKDRPFSISMGLWDYMECEKIADLLGTFKIYEKDGDNYKKLILSKTVNQSVELLNKIVGMIESSNIEVPENLGLDETQKLLYKLDELVRRTNQ